jgi:hypothetical protein
MPWYITAARPFFRGGTLFAHSAQEGFIQILHLEVHALGAVSLAAFGAYGSIHMCFFSSGGMRAAGTVCDVAVNTLRWDGVIPASFSAKIVLGQLEFLIPAEESKNVLFFMKGAEGEQLGGKMLLRFLAYGDVELEGRVLTLESDSGEIWLVYAAGFEKFGVIIFETSPFNNLPGERFEVVELLVYGDFGPGLVGGVRYGLGVSKHPVEDVQLNPGDASAAFSTRHDVKGFEKVLNVDGSRVCLGDGRIFFDGGLESEFPGIGQARIPQVVVVDLGHFRVAYGLGLGFTNSEQLSVYKIRLYYVQGDVMIEFLVFVVALRIYSSHVGDGFAVEVDSFVSSFVCFGVSFHVDGSSDAFVNMLLGGMALDPSDFNCPCGFGEGSLVEVFPEVPVGHDPPVFDWLFAFVDKVEHMVCSISKGLAVSAQVYRPMARYCQDGGSEFGARGTARIPTNRGTEPYASIHFVDNGKVSFGLAD